MKIPLDLFLHLHSSLIHLSTPVADSVAYTFCTEGMTFCSIGLLSIAIHNTSQLKNVAR